MSGELRSDDAGVPQVNLPPVSPTGHETELGETNPWEDSGAQGEFPNDYIKDRFDGWLNPTLSGSGSKLDSTLLTPRNPSSQLSPTSSAASPLARVDASILAEFDPFSSHESGSSTPRTTGSLTDPIDDSQGGHPPGLVLSGLFASGEGSEPTTVEEVVPQPPEKESIASRTIPSQNPSKDSLRKPTDAGPARNQAGPSSTPDSAPPTPSKREPREPSQPQRSRTPSRKEPSEERPAEPVFDFQGFLVQLRSRPAEPIQKFLKRYVWHASL